ncbi:hypothetical protein H4582DRAFT_2075813 [Lactarius indigo]|nr:hypothetical protein H4582DRAFT_2075813 [Lactarius indigo]
MVQNSVLLSRISKPLPCKRPGGALSPLRPCKRHRLGSLPDSDEERRLHSQGSGDHWKPTKRYRRQPCKGMLDIPAELLLGISSHMDHHDFRALAVTSRLLCDLLLPEYLRRRGLKLKDTCTGGTCMELHDLSGYASLGLWSIAPTFRPPKKMYCSIPYDAQEARSAIGFATCFLLNPSNTSNLRNFHFSLWESDPLPIMSELIKLQDLYCVLPLTLLCISGHSSAAYLPSSITLRSGTSIGSHTLTSLFISSDLAFAPGLVRTTMGILNQSPIRRLAIYMVSLNRSQWSTLLGQLNMTLLEDIEVEGDIPRAALIRFLIKHRGLRVIRIRGNVPSDHIQPSRPLSLHFLPNLRTLHAPLTICCDIIRRASDPSNLYELHAEVSWLHLHDPLFLQLVETLRHFRKLDHFGLRLVPSSPTIPQASLGDYNWDGHPACELRQVRRLSFHWDRDLLSPGDIENSDDGKLDIFTMLRPTPTVRRREKWRWQSSATPEHASRELKSVNSVFCSPQLPNCFIATCEMPPSPSSPSLVRRPYARMTSGRTKRHKPDWTFDPNDDTGIILHKTGKCSLCDDWSAHFYDHHAANNATLEAAFQARSRVLQAPLQPAVDRLRKEHDEGRQELAALRWELKEVRQELDAGNNLYQSHTPRRHKYAHPPSPRRLEVPASPAVVAYSPSLSAPDSSSKHAFPDKPQTSRGEEKWSNTMDIVES